ncbi:hypothetical protein B0H14DRAFT_3614798 [Mycena olivaceomarginata]|nr:hypothetical protein B0H14DRAFT_3614798 [Mycena olivaceomarginata]
MSNLSKEELQEALKDAQLKLKRAVTEIKTKDILIAQLQQNSGRKGKPKPSNGLEYDTAIIGWGKKFAVLHEPWITVAVFGPYLEDGPPELETMPEIEQLMFVIADHKENFTETGSVSKILYQKYYRQYKLRFMKYAQTPGIQKIIQFWSSIVFHSVDTSNVVNDQTADHINDGDEADFALAMERMAITVDSDEEDENLDFEMDGPLWDPSLDLDGPAQQEPPASPAVLMLFKAEAQAKLEAEARAKGREGVAVVWAWAQTQVYYSGADAVAADSRELARGRWWLTTSSKHNRSPASVLPNQPDAGYGQQQQPAYGGQPAVDGVVNQFSTMGIADQKQFQLNSINHAHLTPGADRLTLNAVFRQRPPKVKILLTLIITPYRTLNEGDEPILLITHVIACSSMAGTAGGAACVTCPKMFDWYQARNQLGDCWAFAELKVEFVAPTEYMVRAPQLPVYVFLIDVTPWSRAEWLPRNARAARTAFPTSPPALSDAAARPVRATLPLPVCLPRHCHAAPSPTTVSASPPLRPAPSAPPRPSLPCRCLDSARTSHPVPTPPMYPLAMRDLSCPVPPHAGRLPMPLLRACASHPVAMLLLLTLPVSPYFPYPAGLSARVHRWRRRPLDTWNVRKGSEGLPGVTTLRNRMITPPLTTSPGTPQIHEIQKNIDAVFTGITDILASKKVVHQIVMFDKIATEKRIRWDPRTNQFLGICRQHAQNVGLFFNGESDLDEIFDALEVKVNSKGEAYSLVHNATEATIGAVGIMNEDPRLYSVRPILISGDYALDGKKELTCLRTVSLETDGETRRGDAFVALTMKHTLPSTSNIYPLLKDLNDFGTAFCASAESESLGSISRPAIIRTHFQSVGHTVDHIRSVSNPEDKQDVRLAFDMLRDIWSLPSLPPGTSPGVSAGREALRTLGKLLYHFVSPYICVDFSLSEQLEHLSAAAHLALALFRKHGKHFMASLLYTDIMIIIKNAFFCVAKAKVDDPFGKFWLILLGTDRLEELFGLLRTMIGTDANCDILKFSIDSEGLLKSQPFWLNIHTGIALLGDFAFLR